MITRASHSRDLLGASWWGGRAGFWRNRPTRSFWLLIFYLTCVALLGGSARDDVQSLILLQPLAVITLGIGVLGLTRETALRFRWVLTFSGACIFAVTLHLVPLPADWWQSMNGRTLSREIALRLGMQHSAMPITLVPNGTRNALYSLLIPCAAVSLMVQLDRSQRAQLVYVLLGIGALSMALSLMQAAFPTSEILYPYAISSLYVPVGLFANRNHSAVFVACLVSVVATFFWSPTCRRISNSLRGLIVSLLAILALMTIVLTGSRAGLAIFVLALFTLPLIYVNSGRLPKWRVTPKMAAVAILVMVGTLVLLVGARSSILDRFMSGDNIPEARLALWPVVWKMILEYFPFGSGWGSFVEVYQVAEPRQMLMLDYWNHAHNDWLETLLTGGLLGAVLLVAAFSAWALAGWTLARRAMRRIKTDPMGLCGFLVLGYLGLASFVDYPLRVPIMMCVFVMAAIWLEAALREGAKLLEDDDSIV